LGVDGVGGVGAGFFTLFDSWNRFNRASRRFNSSAEGIETFDGLDATWLIRFAKLFFLSSTIFDRFFAPVQALK
jgi:hypothetical protein